MGSNVGKDKELVSVVTKVVREVSKVPAWQSAILGNATAEDALRQSADEWDSLKSEG